MVLTGGFNAMVAKGKEVRSVRNAFSQTQGSIAGIAQRITYHHKQEPCVVGVYRAEHDLIPTLQTVSLYGERPGDLVRNLLSDPQHPVHEFLYTDPAAQAAAAGFEAMQQHGTDRRRH